MLSPDRLIPIENAMRNIVFLFLAGMMEAMSGLVGDLGQALTGAFSGDEPKKDVAAEIRQAMTPEQLGLFEEMEGETEQDSTSRTRILAALDDSTADELLALLPGPEYGLPPLTEKLAPEALLGYCHLLESGDESLQASVREFAQRLQALGEPKNAAELEASAAERMSPAGEVPVKVEIDRASCGEGIEVGPALDEIASAMQQLFLGAPAWKKERVGAIREVHIRAVATPEEKSFVPAADRFDIAVCLTGGPEGWFDGWELSRALSEDWQTEARDQALAVRAARAISLAEGFTAEVSGVRVVVPAEDSDLRPFGDDPGTTVAVTLRRAAGGITKFVSASSRVVACTDDKGGDLSQAADPAGSSSPDFGSFPKLKSDGTACLLEVDLPGNPTLDASELRLRADLTFQVADGTEDHEAKVRWKEGATFTLNDIPFTVTGVSDGGWAFEVTIQTNKHLDELALFRFVKADGEEVGVGSGGSSMTDMGDEVTEVRTLRFESSIDGGRLIGAFWVGQRDVQIPIEVAVRLGL
jgi:hypothetical protein